MLPREVELVHRSREQVCQGVKCKALSAVRRTGYCAIFLDSKTSFTYDSRETWSPEEHVFECVLVDHVVHGAEAAVARSMPTLPV